MTTTIKAAGAADFLRLIPLMLGFLPEESLVVVPFAGSKSLGAMRLDMPRDLTEIDSIASTVMGLPVNVEGATGIAIIAYSTTTSAQDITLILTALERRADETGMRVVDSLYVSATEWGSHLGGTTGPLSDLVIEDTQGLPQPGSILAGTELPEVSERLQNDTRDARIELEGALAIVTGTGTKPTAEVVTRAYAMLATLDDPIAFYEDILMRLHDDLTAHDVALLAWCFERPALRDIALVQWCDNADAGDRALDAQLQWEQGAEYPTSLAMRMWGEGDQPNADRLTRALALMRLVAASVQESERAGLLATAGWISWALGRSTHAQHYVELALAIEPEHGLSEIVLSFVKSGHLPSWAFARRS